MQNFRHNYGQKQLFIFTGGTLLRRYEVLAFKPYFENLINLPSESKIILPGQISTIKMNTIFYHICDGKFAK